MVDRVTLKTERLLLRPWRQEDRPLFAAMNADPAVMEHFPALMTQEESGQFVDRIEQEFATYGYGLWAVEIPGEVPFIGFVGLRHVSFDAPFTPAVEIGWRIRKEYWGKGYAQEAAEAALDFAFETLKLPEIVSFTVPANTRSWKLMERLGMQRAGTFAHTRLPPDHPLSEHVLYKIKTP